MRAHVCVCVSRVIGARCYHLWHLIKHTVVFNYAPISASGDNFEWQSLCLPLGFRDRQMSFTLRKWAAQVPTERQERCAARQTAAGKDGEE